MYDYGDGYGYDDEYGDKDEQRRRRDNPELPPHYPDTGLGPPPEPPTPAPPTGPMPVKEKTSDQGVDMIGPRTPAPPPPPTGGGGQPQFQPAAPAAMAPAPTVQQPSITDDVTRILQARLKELSNPSDVASDPIFKQAFRAYQVDQLRGADRQRKQLAERTAATGGTTSSGGFNVGVRGIQERAGENTARYKSGLTLDRLQSREQQLNQAIAAARSVGQDDIANQLELQRLQLQQELGRSDLALRSELGRGQLNLGYDNLGLSYADLVSRSNRDAVLAGLGG